MSLFKSREWWCTQCGSDEYFESKSFLVTRFNSVYHYVIIGSHSGVLRIYQPSSGKEDDGHLVGYKPNDLIIEIQLPHPILQTCIGRLVSGSQIMQLAVLHPRSLGVYSLVTKSGVAEHGTQNNILLVYEHTLKRSASNLVVGAFGGSQNRDFMCVQSLDGMLSFFEQEIFSFCCFLHEFLLPGPIVFVKSTDSFITISSNWQIESFSYKKLSEYGHNSNQTDTEGKRFYPDWNYNIGENVSDISIVENGSNETNIVILGERTMVCLTDSGLLKFMKRFDFSPQCFQSYYIRASSKLMILIVSETNTLLVFESATLKWSAQLSFLPIAISRGFFGSVDGTLILLSDTGLLQFCYLGTEPQLFAAPPLKNQEIDFEKTEQELHKLNQIIKSHRNNDISFLNVSTEKELILNVNVNQYLEACTFQHEIILDKEEFLPMCLVTVELVPNVLLEEVQVSLIVQHPLKIYPNIHFINNLEEKVIFDSYVYLWKPLEISSLEVKVVVSNIATTGIPRILSKTAQLPMKLTYVAHSPFKDAEHKVTLNINDQAPTLSVLFPEYTNEQSAPITSSAACFKSISNAGSPVTILLAKNSQRYRLQSNSAASLNLLVEQLDLRLKIHFEKSEISITFSSTLPAPQFLNIIHQHFVKRETVTTLQNQLSELAAQFRLIQKRLITKFKDKNPTPLNNLDILMLETYSEIITCSETYQREKEELLKVQCELSCIIRLILNILNHSEVPQEILKHINSVFVTPVCDIEGQEQMLHATLVLHLAARMTELVQQQVAECKTGLRNHNRFVKLQSKQIHADFNALIVIYATRDGWEDVIEICMSHLFRTVIAKSDKDRLKNTANSLEQIKDVAKFKKRVSLLLDRAMKTNDVQNNVPTVEEKGTEVKEIPEVLPQVGNTIAVSSVRAQSAKMARKKLLSTPEEIEGEEV